MKYRVVIEADMDPDIIPELWAWWLHNLLTGLSTVRKVDSIEVKPAVVDCPGSQKPLDKSLPGKTRVTCPDCNHTFRYTAEMGDWKVPTHFTSTEYLADGADLADEAV
jgi:hypothetical protein